MELMMPKKSFKMNQLERFYWDLVSPNVKLLPLRIVIEVLPAIKGSLFVLLIFSLQRFVLLGGFLLNSVYGWSFAPVRNLSSIITDSKKEQKSKKRDTSFSGTFGQVFILLMRQKDSFSLSGHNRLPLNIQGHTSTPTVKKIEHCKIIWEQFQFFRNFNIDAEQLRFFFLF